MLPTLMIIFPGLASLVLLFPKIGFRDALPISPAIGTGIFYLVNIFLYLYSQLSFSQITLAFILISLISLIFLIIRYHPGKDNIKTVLKDMTGHPLLIAGLAVIYLLFTFWPPSGWDSITLYDFRAKLIQDRLSFSEMLTLSQTDSYNPTYYLSYPPLVSFVHAFYYELGTNPVVFDFFSYIMTLFCLYLILTRPGKNSLTAMIIFPFALAPVLLNHIGYGYTNLVYAYLFFASVYLVVYLAKFRLNFYHILVLGLIASAMKVTRWVEPFYVLPVFTGILMTREPIMKKAAFLAAAMGIIFVLTRHWSLILNASPDIFIQTGLGTNLSLISSGAGEIIRVTWLFWQKLSSYWPLFIVYIPLSLYLLAYAKSRTQKYLNLNILVSLGLMYLGSVLVYLQLPGRLEIFDSLNRLPMFLLPLIWASLGLSLVM